MRPALCLLLAAAAIAPTNSNEDACAVILKEEGLDARACAALDACVRRAARAAGARDAPSLWRLLRRCTAADELLFPVSLALMGELRKPNGASVPGTARLAPERSADIEDKRLTYCDWSRGGTSPKTFDALTAASPPAGLKTLL